MVAAPAPPFHLSGVWTGCRWARHGGGGVVAVEALDAYAAHLIWVIVWSVLLALLGSLYVVLMLWLGFMGRGVR